VSGKDLLRPVAGQISGRATYCQAGDRSRSSIHSAAGSQIATFSNAPGSKPGRQRGGEGRPLGGQRVFDGAAGKRRRAPGTCLGHCGLLLEVGDDSAHGRAQVPCHRTPCAGGRGDVADGEESDGEVGDGEVGDGEVGDGDGDDGDGDGEVGDGEGDGEVGDGEGDGEVGDGEGEVGDGEGDGEGEGEVGDGEGEVGDGEGEVGEGPGVDGAEGAGDGEVDDGGTGNRALEGTAGCRKNKGEASGGLPGR
jgi:hypothetical protein